MSDDKKVRFYTIIKHIAPRLTEVQLRQSLAAFRDCAEDDIIRVPVLELQQLAEQWEKLAAINEGSKFCADRLRAVIKVHVDKADAE